MLLTAVVSILSGGIAAAQQVPRNYFSEPALAPDRPEMAFVAGGDIWRVAATGGEASLLVSHPASFGGSFGPGGCACCGGAACVTAAVVNPISVFGSGKPLASRTPDSRTKYSAPACKASIGVTNASIPPSAPTTRAATGPPLRIVMVAAFTLDTSTALENRTLTQFSNTTSREPLAGKDSATESPRASADAPAATTA